MLHDTHRERLLPGCQRENPHPPIKKCFKNVSAMYLSCVYLFQDVIARIITESVCKAEDGKCSSNLKHSRCAFCETRDCHGEEVFCYIFPFIAFVIGKIKLSCAPLKFTRYLYIITNKMTQKCRKNISITFLAYGRYNQNFIQHSLKCSNWLRCFAFEKMLKNVFYYALIT